MHDSPAYDTPHLYAQRGRCWRIGSRHQNAKIWSSRRVRWSSVRYSPVSVQSWTPSWCATRVWNLSDCAALTWCSSIWGETCRALDSLTRVSAVLSFSQTVNVLNYRLLCCPPRGGRSLSLSRSNPVTCWAGSARAIGHIHLLPITTSSETSGWAATWWASSSGHVHCSALVDCRRPSLSWQVSTIGRYSDESQILFSRTFFVCCPFVSVI